MFTYSTLLLMLAVFYHPCRSVPCADIDRLTEVFVEDPEDQSGAVGSQVVFSCRYHEEGVGFRRGWSWEFYQQGGNRFTIRDNASFPHDFRLSLRGELTIPSVRLNHTGEYRCHALPSLNCDVFSLNASLTVIIRSPTTATSTLTTKTITTMSCAVYTSTKQCSSPGTGATSTPAVPSQSADDGAILSLYVSVGVSGAVIALIAAVVIVISVTVCRRKRNNKHVNATIYQSSSGQVVMKTNEAYAETRASDFNYTDDMYVYATQPTTAILTSNTAYNVHTSMDAVPTSSTARIPTYTNDAYDVTCRETDIAISTNEAYGITRKANEATSHDGTDIPAESVPTSANQAYGTAICQNTDDTYDYI